MCWICPCGSPKHSIGQIYAFERLFSTINRPHRRKVTGNTDMIVIKNKNLFKCCQAKPRRYSRDLCRDQRTNAAKDRPVNGPLVRLKLGLGVKRHTDRGISCRRGRRDVNLWALGVLLSGACHLSTHKMIRKRRFSLQSLSASPNRSRASCRSC